MKPNAILTMLALAFLLSGVAVAADRPLYQPPAAWVRPEAVPDVAPATDGSPVQVLLDDTQFRLGETDEIYSDHVIRLLNPQGLAAAATVSLPWNPDTETLIFHHLLIRRGGETIDLLAGGKAVTVLRRETSLEAATLDGELTATVQPEGLRVGDVLDLSVSMTRQDPVLHGRSEATAALRYAGVAGRVRIRVSWPDAKPIRWRAAEGLPAPVMTRSGGMSELLVDVAGQAAPKQPADAPARFADVGELQLTQFATWAEVAGLVAPLYDKAARLGDDPALKARVDRIRAASNDPKARAEAALRLVQDEVHYVFLGMNFGGYVPADASVTWQRRFGDCKGKTALLLALLHALGVEAEPALASTTWGDGLDARLPRLDAFDHVITRARIGRKVYWLDATRTGDRRLDDILVPDFHWVLPLQATGGALERAEAVAYAAPAFESLQRLDATKGFDAPAAAHVEHIYRGDAAVGWRLLLDGKGRADAERGLKEHWRQQYSWIEPTTVDFHYDDAGRVMTLSLDGVARMDWIRNGGFREFAIADSNLGFSAVFKREPGPHADAPFTVPFPAYDKRTVQVVLPSNAAGFFLAGAPAVVDQTIAGRRYQRHARIDSGVVTMVAEEQSLAPEFPASAASAASDDLRALGRFNVVVRGLDVAAASQPVDDDGTLAVMPRDATGFALRGVKFEARKDYARAIADFTEAVRLEPLAARHVYDRGAARFQLGQDDLALSDFNQALRLDPRHVLALMARADLFLLKGESARSAMDYEAALRLAPDPAVVLQRRADALDRAGQYKAEIADLDRLIARVPAPTGDALARLLDARCWARAEWGRQLEAALDDCSAALTQMPAAADILDSRGLVRLRLARFAEAIDDYTAALSLSPRVASSLFGRGLARLRSGDLAGGAADLASARAVTPGIDAVFARYGVKPPAGATP